MTQEEFKRRHAPSWRHLESMIASLGAGKRRRIVGAAEVVELSEFDSEYRRVCKHLSLARQRLYGTDLVAYLDDLTLRAHRHFYGQGRRFLPGLARFVLGGFAALVREHAGAVAVSTLLFVVPALGVTIALSREPDLVHAVLGAEQVRRIEEMYEPGAHYRSRDRAADTDLAMFGYYVSNNVGIGFRTFAGGVVFGLGSIYFVAFNGLFLGAVVAHLALEGHGDTFFPFVAGHSAPELTAIVLAGAAGLNLGFSLIAPSRLRRADALRRAASSSIRMVGGVAALLLAAALIEAFWSPRENVPDALKLAAGAILWLLTLGYFVFAGRDHGS
jgi:uncharacterized membrane protein SpoIIM required for sporulation